jgi:cysteine desulfurase family protein (TIGR01976 family)
MDFPLDWVRRAFPALDERSHIFLDNGAGAQVPQAVVQAVTHHLLRRNVQRGGRYRLSQEVDRTIEEARESIATFLNAFGPHEIVLGQNATGFIVQVSQAMARWLKPGDEMVVTELDHEANITPWLALQDQGFRVKFWPVRPEEGRLDLLDLERLMTERTRLVAVTKASNALGTIVDLKPVAERIHERGGYLFVDAVHFAPHGPLDVRYLGCDFLVCSGYKIFGPHMGFLWGKGEILDRLPTLREQFIPDRAPDKYELGTFSYEAMAGMSAALGYLEEIGRRSADLPLPPVENGGRRGNLRRGMQAIRHYERTLTEHALRRLGEVPGLRIHGISDPVHAADRTPTFCFTLRGRAPVEVTERMAERGIFIRDGHLYCPRLLERMGIAPEPGAVRASLVHYNSFQEVDRLASELASLSES